MASPPIIECADGGAYQYAVGADGQVYETSAATGLTRQITTVGPNANLRLGADGASLQYVQGGVGKFQAIPSDGVEHLIYPSRNLYLCGDSLLKLGGLGCGAALSALYLDRNCVDQAMGTQRSEHMAARSGCTVINGAAFQYNVVGGTIPATTTPVALLPLAINLFFAWNYPQGSFNGVIAGVPGLIAYDSTSGSGAQTFTRSAPGAAVHGVNPASIQVTSGWATNTTGTGAPAFLDIHERTSILMIGYNDVRAHWIGPPAVGEVFNYSLANTLGNIAAIDALFSAKVRRRIWGLPPQSALVLTPDQCKAIDASPGGPYGFCDANGVPLGIAADDSRTLGFLNDMAALRAALASTYPYTADFMAGFKAAGHTVSWPIGGASWDFIRPDFNNGATDGTHWKSLQAQAQAARVCGDIIDANDW